MRGFTVLLLLLIAAAGGAPSARAEDRRAEGHVQGRIVMPEGAPLPKGVSVRASYKGGSRGCADLRVDEDGAFEGNVGCGEVEVFVTADGYAPRVLKSFQLGPNQKVAGLEAKLDRGFTGTIQLKSPSGSGPSGGTVSAKFGTFWAASIDDLPIDDHGRVTITHCPSRPLSIWVRTEGFEPQTFKTVELSPNRATTLTLTPAAPAAVRVVDARTLRPIWGARFTCHGWSSPGRMVCVQPDGPERVSGPDGRVAFRMLKSDTTYNYFVNADGYDSVWIRLRAGDDHRVAIEPLIEVSGEIRGPPDMLRRVRIGWRQPVALAFHDEAERRDYRVQIDDLPDPRVQNGRIPFRITNLYEGEFTLYVSRGRRREWEKAYETTLSRSLKGLIIALEGFPRISSDQPPQGAATRNPLAEIDYHLAMLEVGGAGERIDAARAIASACLRQSSESGRPLSQGELGRVAPPLIKAVDASSHIASLNIIRILGRLLQDTRGRETDAALAYLIEVIRSDTHNLRHTAVQVLGDLGPTARPAARHLTGLLKDSPNYQRLAILRALIKIAPRRRTVLRAVRHLLATVQDEPERETQHRNEVHLGTRAADVRIAAYGLLHQFKAVRLLDAMPIARAMVEAEFITELRTAAHVLSGMERLPPEIVPHLLTSRVGRRSLLIETDVVSPLFAKVGPDAVPTLLAATRSDQPLDAFHGLPDEPPRRFAWDALVALGPQARAALPTLMAIVQNHDFREAEYQYGWHLPRQALRAIHAITAGDMQPIVPLLRHEDENVRTVAVLLLVGTDDARVPHLQSAQNDESALVRMAVHAARVAPDRPDDIDALCDALLSEDLRVRNLAIGTLRTGYFYWGPEDRLRWLRTHPRVIARMTEFLRDQNAEAYFGALEFLRFTRPLPIEAVPSLVRALKDADASVRRAAAAALRNVKDADAAAQAVPHLLAALRHPDPATRRSALNSLCWIRRIETLADQEPVAAIERELIEAMRDDKTRRSARSTLIRTGLYERSLATLMEELRVPHEQWSLFDAPKEKLHALAALAEMGPNAAPAVELIADHLKAPELRLVRAAAYALVKLGPDAKPAVHALIVALEAPDDFARLYAMDALETLEVASAAPGVMEGLAHGGPAVRCSAARWLGRMRVTEAVKPLGQSLKDLDAGVRLEAAIALGRMGRPATAAAAPLREATRDENPRVRLAAQYALSVLGDDDASRISLIRSAKSHSNIVVRQLATRLLAR